MALKGFISIAEFDILELIGGGAYGRVFKAKRKNEKETFAIKCIKLSNDDDVELVYSSMRELTVRITFQFCDRLCLIKHRINTSRSLTLDRKCDDCIIPI